MPYNLIAADNAERAAIGSREAAEECSPRREPWGKEWNMSEPRRGVRQDVTQSQSASNVRDERNGATWNPYGC